MKKYFTLWVLLLCGTFAASASGLWTRKNDFAGNPRDRSISFSIGDFGYYGCGNHYGGSAEMGDMWKYDPTTDSWMQISDYPLGMQAGEVFVLNDQGYVGSGWRSGYSFSDWYRYDPLSNSWSALASFPVNTVHDAGVFTLNGRGYVVGGAIPYSNNNTNTLFEYDPTSNIWSQKSNFPQYRRVPFAAGVNGMAYVGLGQQQNTQANSYEMYRYDPVSDSWTTLGTFPNTTSPTYDSRRSSFVLNDTVYIVLEEEFWRYIPALDQWDALGSTPFLQGVDGSFTINDKAYVILHNSNEVWEFDPHGVPDVNSAVCDTLYYSNGNQNWFAQLIRTSDGNLVTVGTENQIYNWANGDIVLSKYDTAFNLIWSRKFYVGGGMDIANGVLQTSDGGLLIHKAFGNTNSPGSFSSGYILKTDSAGNLEWEQTLMGQSSGDNYSSAAVENSQGEFIIYGHVQDHPGCNGYATRMSKLSATGSILWSNCFPLNPDRTGGIVKLPFLDAYISAYNDQSTGAVELRSWDNSGNQTGLINYQYGNQFNSTGSVMPCPSGGFFLAGQFDRGNGNRNAFVTKFDDAMNMQWESTDSVYNENYFYNVFIDANGTVYCTGGTNVTGQPGDLIMSVFDGSGQFIRHELYGAAGTEDYGSGIVALANGDVVCSGRSGSEALLVKMCGSVVTSLADQPGKIAPITVFPNPAADRIRVRLNNSFAESVRCRIFNTSGQCVLDRIYKSIPETEMYLPEIADGVYFLQVVSGSTTFNSRFVVAR